MGLLERLFGPRPASAECARVGAVIQQYLDNEYELDAQWIVDHLDVCRDCGLEASTYADIKSAIARHGVADPAARQRLRAFADQLADGEIDPVA